MSVWTNVTGTVWISKHSHFSFNKAIVDMFEEARPKISQTAHTVGQIKVEFEFNFSDNNLNAAKTLQQFCDRIKAADKDAWIDIEAQIRFVG